MVDEREDGFSLVELMVVVLIIAVLMAIAIPVFLGARQRANERAVQSNVRNAFTAARLYYNKAQQYSDDPAVMDSEEPGLHWTDQPLVDGLDSRKIYIRSSDENGPDQTVVVAGRTKDGHCFYLRDVMNGLETGTYFDADVPAGGTCNPPGGGWGDAW